ncbi:CHAP domain-containing protein [Janibacter sp. RAF20_2_2]
MLLGVSIAAAAPSGAAKSHFNTNPYTTKCAKSSYVLSSKAVSGGTARIMVSRTCGTNWIEYVGKVQTTTKSGKDFTTNRWTRTEVDKLGHAVSMQSYAPGRTKYTAYVKIGSTTTTATCTSTCSWKVTSPPTPKPTLSRKVDSFVTKWKGRYADFDGRHGAQCVDLAQYYNRDVVGARFMSTPYSWGAKDIWRTYDAGKYTRVAPSKKAAKGDVAVWDGMRSNGYAGHIAIVLVDQGSSVKVLSQNPGATKVMTISKSRLLGYLRPKAR